MTSRSLPVFTCYSLQQLSVVQKEDEVVGEKEVRSY